MNDKDSMFFCVLVSMIVLFLLVVSYGIYRSEFTDFAYACKAQAGEVKLFPERCIRNELRYIVKP